MVMNPKDASIYARCMVKTEEKKNRKRRITYKSVGLVRTRHASYGLGTMHVA
jgi:hypothetical protein